MKTIFSILMLTASIASAQRQTAAVYETNLPGYGAYAVKSAGSKYGVIYNPVDSNKEAISNEWCLGHAAASDGSGATCMVKWTDSAITFPSYSPTLSNYVLKAGDTMTGTLNGTSASLSGTLGVTGASTMSGQLTVTSSLTVTGEISAAQMLLRSTSATANHEIFEIRDLVNSKIFHVHQGDGFSFFTDTVTIKQNGRVGIGTGTPTAQLDLVGTDFPVYKTTRLTTVTNSFASSNLFLTQSSGQMADGFGGGLVYAGQDADGVQNLFASVGAVRDGADNSGALYFNTYQAGGANLGRMVIKANGNIGINTTAPGAKLDVVGDANISTSLTAASMTVTGNAFSVGGSTLVVTGGKVGIGTNAPDTLLQITGGNNANATLGQLKIAGTGTVGGYLQIEDAGTKAWFMGVTDGDSGFHIREDGSNVLPRVYVKAGGNVGIGTTAPNSKLSLGSTTGSKLLMYDGGTIAGGGNGYFAGLGIGLADGNSFDILAHNGGNLRFGRYLNNNDLVNYVNWMTILNSGYVGIGTTNPVTKLQVGVGNTAADTAIAKFNTSDTNVSALALSNWDGGATTYGPRIHFDNSGRGEWYIGSSDGANNFDIAAVWGTPLVRIDSDGATTGGALCLNASKVLSKCTSAIDASGNCTCP